MDGLQLQIIDLNGKVDRLHDIVERLSSQIAQLTAQQQPLSDSKVERFTTLTMQSPPSYFSNGSNGRYHSLMEHKDILVDDDKNTSLMTTTSEQTLSADIQIRRLTAQLTAAYNRIAALEEQLLAHRIHA